MRTRTRNLKRLLSLALCLCMVTGLLPVTALAADAPAITTEKLEGATVGEKYTATLTAEASEAQSELSWTASDLPTWLAIINNSDGTATLDGTPTEAGEVTFTVTVTETIPAETEEPAEEPAAEEPAEEPAGEPAEEPAGEPAEEPAGEPAAGAEPTVLTAWKEYTLTVAAAPANEPETDPNRGTEPEAEPGTEPGADSLLTDGGTTRGSYTLKGFTAKVWLASESNKTETTQISTFQTTDTLHVNAAPFDTTPYWTEPASLALLDASLDVTEANCNSSAIHIGVGVNNNGTMGVFTAGTLTGLEIASFQLLDLNGYSVNVTEGNSYRFVVWDDTAGAIFYSTNTFTVTAGSGTVSRPTIDTDSLPGAAVNQAYQATLEATPGTPGNTLTWALEPGSSLPAGLTLKDNGNGTATISGTPTEPVTVYFYLAVTEKDSSGGAVGTVSKGFSIRMERTPFQFTLEGDIDADLYGSCCYLKGTKDGTELTLWSGTLKEGTTSLTVSEQYLGAELTDVKLVYYRSGSKDPVDVAAYQNGTSLTLTVGGRAALTGQGDVLAKLPTTNPNEGIGGTLWFQDSSGMKYFSGALAPNQTYTLGADLYYSNYQIADEAAAEFRGYGVTENNGVYTYDPAQNPNNSPITLWLDTADLKPYTVQLVSDSGEPLPDLSGARIHLSQRVAYRTYSATGTVEYQEGTNSATVELYSGVAATASLVQSGQYFVKDTQSITPNLDNDPLQLTVLPSEIKDMSLALSAMPEGADKDETLAEYAQLLKTSISVTLGNISLGNYSMPTDLPEQKYIYASYRADTLNNLYTNGAENLALSWGGSGPVNPGQTTINWSKGSLSEHAELTISVKGGVLAEVTNQSDAVYFVPWWYNETSGWSSGDTVRVGVDATESLALWRPDSTDTAADWNLLLLTSDMVGPRGMNWEAAQAAYPGMPYLEGISVQNNHVEKAAMTVKKDAVESILYPTKPYSTFVGPDQFESTDDLLVYTGHIQLKEDSDSKLKELWLDAAGTDTGGRVATQISSVVVDGVEYPYTKIELAGETDYDQLVSKQFTTYYRITFKEPVELPCDFTVYAKPMLEASDAVLTASVCLDPEGSSNSFHLVGKATVKAPDLSVSIPSITGGDTVTAYVTAPKSAGTVRVYDGDELVATARSGSVQIPLCGTSTSMTTSHRLTFQYTDASGAVRSVTRTVLHAAGLPTVTEQYLQVNWRNVSRNTVYSFTSANPAPFQMTCTIENAENIAGGVSFAVRFLDGTVRYIEAKQSGNTFTTEAFTSGSPVIGAQVLYELDWDKVQKAMNENLTVPNGTLGGSKSFDSTVVLPWSDYKNELTQYQEAFQYLEENEEEAQEYQTALKTNGDEMKNEGTLNFGRASSRDPVGVNSGAKTAQEMFDHLDAAAITNLQPGQTLYTGFTRRVTQEFFQAELGTGSGFSRLILADSNDIKYEMYVKLIELANKEGTGTLVLAADYVTGGEGNPLYMEIGSVAVQGTAATASAANIGGGGNTAVLAGSALAALPKSGATRDTQSSAPSSGGYYFTDIGDDQTMSAMDYASCVSDGYVTGMSTGLDVINTAGYYIDGTVDSVGESGFAAGGYTTALSVAGVGKATYDTAVNYSTLGDLYTMSANLLNSPCAQKLAKVNPGFISNMQNQLTEYKAMLDDAGAWNIGMGAYNIVNGAVGAAGGYAIPWVTLATAGLGMFGDAIVKQKVSNCEATGTVLYDTMQLFIKKYANQYDDPECKGGGGGDIPKDKDQEKNPEDPYRACIDPSGVVYEAVLSNPVEGATVTLYADDINYTPKYNTARDDLGNDSGIQIMVNSNGTPAVPTNAGSASRAKLSTPEENTTIPAETVLTTGADGRYQWMVTEGLWFVTAHKDGYQAGDSGDDVAAVVEDASGRCWLPVSPEQLNVNIPLVSYETPTVTAEAREDGVYLTFSKYMDESTLKADGAFQINGTAVNPSNVELLNSEKAPDNIDYGGSGAPSYTSQVKLNAANLTGNVTVTIGSGVKSYAGVPYTTLAAGAAISGTVSDGPLVTAPTINGGGQVAYGSTVTIDVPKGAAVYYTTDGTTPSANNGTRYYAGQEIPVTRNMTLQAVAVKYGETSGTVSATFTVPDNAKTATIGDPNNQTGTSPGGDTPGGGEEPGGNTPGGNTPVNPGGGSGDSGYSISVPSSSSIKGGSITVSPRSADKGDTVTITVKPDDGYELNKLTVTDAKGNELELTNKGNGKYTFSMPGSSVKIQVSFKEIAEQVVNPFTDVYESDYYYDAVLWAVANGVTAGTSATTFSPNAPVTRAQAMTFLWRAHGSPKATGSNPFADVSADAWYYDAVLWAVANGVTVGTSATTFSPDAPVTRSQAVTFQWRAAGSPVIAGDSFDDVAADAYYAGAVAWAVAGGITNGTGGNQFSPDVVVTRAQAVTFLWRELA